MLHQMNPKFKMAVGITLVLALLLTTQIPSLAQKKEKGFVQIFDGQSLKGWEGDTKYWRVENGNLVGEITPERC
jgi:hypothetical protein